MVDSLAKTRLGAGTLLRQTRMMKGKEAATELEVTESVVNERVRIVSDTHGTVWDTVFTTAEKDGCVELTMVMEARAHRFMARLVNPVIRGMVAKAVEGDMEAVKEYCEKR